MQSDASHEASPLVVRVDTGTKRELEAVAREHHRSVAAEMRAAVDAWLDQNRKELLAAWRAETEEAQ